MGKTRLLEICFDGPVDAFYAGTQVSGKVMLDLSENQKVQAIKLRVFGQAAVLIRKSDKPTRNPSEEETYMDETEILFGGNESSLTSGSLILSKGIHEFRFLFRLRDNLPSSFESPYGFVRFWCRASLHRPWKPQQSVKRPFTVVGLLQLSDRMGAFLPGQRCIQRTFSFWERLICCAAGGVTMNLNIDRCAFVPGEHILLNGEVSNYSDKRITCVQAFLQQNLSFRSKKVVKQCMGLTKIGCVEKGPVEFGETQIWRSEPFPVPALPPTDLAGCNLIHISYLLKFVAVVANGGPNVHVSIPIVIGTVPLEPVYTAPPRRSSIAASAPMEPTPLEPSAPPALESFIGPPPSYSECVGMYTADIRDPEDENEDTEGTFRPLYPTYATLVAPPPPPPQQGPPLKESH
ncbi:hypothetical protein M514_06916 [Trichuris suis]|uniref:Arrestin C-terminal-like domain-containing protein n=1 Tax=Trichuris suis TaxID=68888 RepID=A0A085NLK8_9BILA|nr:hypothetical protein M513_06916 [Trichuris suis]KFD70354.1 hypothetical protein M514_06916 [Trichuris suis]